MKSLLRHFAVKRAMAPPPDAQVIDIDGQKIALRFRRNAAARRMVLRLDAKSGGLVMTLPARAGLAEALRFAAQSRDWIARTLAKQPQATVFVDGITLLYRGQPHVLRLTGGRRGLVEVGGGQILVPGEAQHAPRRLKDFFGKQAQLALTAASQNYAAAMDTRFSRISIRDQKSRWGSCSAKGVLSYSWRLILAPDFVLDYVAAHEVAHLREMNHGPRFWRLVLTHCQHARQAKQWLKAHGKHLHQFL